MHLVGSRTLVILGLLLALWTGYGAARNLWLTFSGKLAEGVVVQQLEEFSADWNNQLAGPLGTQAAGVDLAAAERLYRAVVRFKENGRDFDVLANVRAKVHIYPLGSKVDVVFPPGQPGRARLRSELPDSWLQAGLLFAATVLGAGSGRLWWHLVRRRMMRRRVVKPSE